MNTQVKPKSGFTIIEVVLVLAIAGLIFLIVFLAVPALQRSQRDTARKQDVGRVISSIQAFQSNNKGVIPTVAQANSDLIPNYLKKESDFADPSGGDYNFSASAADNLNTGRIQYVVGAKCNGTTTTAAGNRSVAVVIQVETGGTYCQNN